MKRPDDIYIILGKISDGTILNDDEYLKLEEYIGGLEDHAERS